ncbi:MAG: glycogen-binding domain-containing protein [Elusimicrobiota bacterium]
MHPSPPPRWLTAKTKPRKPSREAWQSRLLAALFFAAAAAALWRPAAAWLDAFRNFRRFSGTLPAVPAGEPARKGLLAGAFQGDEPLPEKQPREVAFRILAPAAKEVFLGGTFNDFDARRNPLARRPDGVWEATLYLLPGEYLYKFKVDGRWELDPANPERTPEPRESSVLTIH